MTAAPLVLAAALVAWGSVAPGPPESPAETGEPSSEAAAAPAETATTETLPPASPPPAAAPARIQPAIIAKAPVVVRAAPAPVVAAPARANERNLQRTWWFWAIAGGLLATAIVVTVVATRPGPQPYGGNTPPYVVTFP